MSDSPSQGGVARPIDWQASFPVLRLLVGMRSACNLTRILLAFSAVILCYLAGRVLDSAWVPIDQHVSFDATSHLPFQDEVEQFISTRNEIERSVGSASGVHAARQGPFITFVSYEVACLANGVRGILAGRLGWEGSTLGPFPSMLGSLGSAAGGVIWLVTAHPWFALLYGLIHLCVFGIFGTAICRHAAVRAARGISLEYWEALSFAWERRTNVALLGVGPIAILLVISAVLIAGGWLFGLLCGIPVLGFVAYVFLGLVYVVALLGGAFAALLIFSFALALPLARAAMAAKGGDVMDAAQSGVSYTFQRPWRYAIYVLSAAVYSALALVVAEIALHVTLKITHDATGAGFSAFGIWHAQNTPTADAFDALWTMPAWGVLSGSFGSVPLSAGETVAMWLIALWVFALVGLLAAYGVSLFYTGATHAYLLLRKDVDGHDYDDVYYLEPDDPFGFGPLPGEEGGANAGGSAAAGEKPKGVSLPVVK